MSMVPARHVTFSAPTVMVFPAGKLKSALPSRSFMSPLFSTALRLGETLATGAATANAPLPLAVPAKAHEQQAQEKKPGCRHLSFSLPSIVGNGAPGRTRTSTLLRATDFESVSSQFLHFPQNRRELIKPFINNRLPYEGPYTSFPGLAPNCLLVLPWCFHEAGVRRREMARRRITVKSV